MALKLYKPTSPGRRALVLVSRKGVWKGKPHKPLVRGCSRTGGRNNRGCITSRHIGGGGRKVYRLVDFKRNKFGVEAVVERIEYDPNRSAFIALIRYHDNEVRYILAPHSLAVGDRVGSGTDFGIRVGNTLKLASIPVGTMVHNIELKPKGGGKIARSAGGYAQLVGKDSGYALLRLRSGEMRLFLENCLATIGVVSNASHQNINLGKAGRSRWMGRRPSVRGVAMNPVDHPHGGGEGKTSGGRHPVSPTGVLAKGKRTRNSKKSTRLIVKKRYKK